MNLTWTGGTLSFDNSSGTFALPGSSTTSLLVNTDAVNGFLSTHGSGITFSALGASSNFPGGTPIPTQATLNETGTAVLAGAGAAAITVNVTQGGFTTPSGTPGTLNSGQTAILTNVAAGGSESSNSSYNAVLTPTLTSTSTGTQLQAFSPSNSIGVGTIVSGYSLDNTANINFGASTPGPGTTDQFAVGATLTAAVPEPASLVLMLTGLPLPLVVMGLLRRRRAAG